MRAKVLTAVVFLAVFAGASAGKPKDSDARDGKAVVADVAKALGANGLKSLQYSGTGFLYFFGEGYKPTDAWPKFNLKSYTRTLDFTSGASEEKEVWTQFDDEVGGAFLKLKGESNSDTFLSGDAAWNIGGNGNPNPAPAAVEERQMQFLMTPQGWVEAAMNASPTVQTKSVGGKKMTVVSFAWKGKYKVNGYVDSQNMLEKVDTLFIPNGWDGNPDSLVETDFSNYQDFAGVKFPMKIVQKEGGFPVLDLTVSDVQPNAAVKIDVPAAARSAVIAPVMMVTTPLADGMWMIRGGGTQSVAVEFKDYMAVIDQSATAERARAVIAEVKKLAPDKPIRYEIHTHHHFDHMADLRTFAAAGATIITADLSKPYYEKTVFNGSYTLSPDDYSKNPKPVKFITVKDKYVLTDGNQSIEVYTVPGNTHAADMLMEYLPKAKTVVLVDIFNPAPPPRPDAPLPANIASVGLKENVQSNLQRLNLDVVQFVSAHFAGPTPFADLQKNIDVERDLVQKFAAAGK
jgi:glyoxylase-like metal-dependent hydrolase (beta-lactamase superfamily II)